MQHVIEGVVVIEEFINFLWKAFFGEGDNTQEHKEQLNMSVNLKGTIASSSNENATIFHNFEEKRLDLFSIF
jgi:hypothetical protein